MLYLVQSVYEFRFIFIVLFIWLNITHSVFIKGTLVKKKCHLTIIYYSYSLCVCVCVYVRARARARVRVCSSFVKNPKPNLSFCTYRVYEKMLGKSEGTRSVGRSRLWWRVLQINIACKIAIGTTYYIIIYTIPKIHQKFPIPC